MKQNSNSQTDAFIRKILKIECPVSVTLAEKKMTLKEILNLSIGTIIEFDKRSDDLLDVVVNNCVIARGETVKVGENYGLQIKETVSIHTAIRSLGKT